MRECGGKHCSQTNENVSQNGEGLAGFPRYAFIQPLWGCGRSSAPSIQLNYLSIQIVVIHAGPLLLGPPRFDEPAGPAQGFLGIAAR